MKVEAPKQARDRCHTFVRPRDTRSEADGGDAGNRERSERPRQHGTPGWSAHLRGHRINDELLELDGLRTLTLWREEKLELGVRYWLFERDLDGVDDTVTPRALRRGYDATSTLFCEGAVCIPTAFGLAPLCPVLQST